MTELELKDRIIDLLSRKGLADCLDLQKSQFLELPGQWFVELVLTDAEKMGEAAKVVEEFKRQTGGQGRLDVIVRARWELVEVKDPTPALSDSGGYRAAVTLPAVLRSGNSQITVTVDVTYSGLQTLEKIAGRAEKEGVKEMVAHYLRDQLVLGGTSYWNPLRDSHREINDAGVVYLMSSARK